MNTVILILSILIFTSVGGFLYIRHLYRDFCRREDQKERIDELRKKVFSANELIRTRYTTPMDHSVRDNLIPKIEFIVTLISSRDPEGQEKELSFLVDILTETFLRLETHYGEVDYIMAPINSMRDRLAMERIQFLKSVDEDAELN